MSLLVLVYLGYHGGLGKLDTHPTSWAGLYESYQKSSTLHFTSNKALCYPSVKAI